MRRGKKSRGDRRAEADSRLTVQNAVRISKSQLRLPSRTRGHPSGSPTMFLARSFIRPPITPMRCSRLLNSPVLLPRPLPATPLIRQKCTISQILRGAHKLPKWKRGKRRESPDLLSNPFKKGVALKVFTTSPKVPKPPETSNPPFRAILTS
jgi:hypothetical protein